MKPVAALVAVVLAVLATMLVGGPAEAVADGGLQFEFADVTPRVVTADGPAALTVDGTLTNEGSTPITDLEVRVQRGNPLTTEGQVRDALDGEAATDVVQPPFVPLAEVLQPGDRLPVHLSVPLRGSAQSGLALSATGVHELLINVNGTPEGGTRARLAAARMLLPVLGLPGGQPGPVRTDPTPLTVLYPIADVPHRLSTVPGAPVQLADDTLAASFGPRGRLGGLVAALAQRAPVGSAVRTGICLAIDPDLVETAAAMSQGYQVVGPNGTTTPGTGQAAATLWLSQLQAVARGGCVLPLPYADADLVALNRGGLTDSAQRALTAGRQILASLLQTPVVTDMAWPADGLVDGSTLGLITAAGTRTVLLSADAVGGRARSGVVPLAGVKATALLTDPLLTRAAAGTDETPTAPGPGAAATPASPAGAGGPLATQDLIGALEFRTATPTPLLLAPPQVWGTDGAGARALLDAIGTFAGTGRITPVAVTDADAAPPSSAPVKPEPPVESSEVPATAVGTVATAFHDLDDLRSAVVDTGVGISADQLFAPLDLGLLRGVSAAHRGSPAAAQAAATAERDQVAAIRNSIRVLEPPSPYSLGSSNAPLPITIANALPVTVRVRIEIASTSGLAVTPIEAQQIPPLGRRQVAVNAQVTRAGQFTVEAAVRTPDGGLLGPPSRLRVRSTAYGTITGWLTAIAGGLLVLLAGRRIWRRVRGESGPTAPVDPTPAPASPTPAAASPTPAPIPTADAPTELIAAVGAEDPAAAPTQRLPRPTPRPGP